MPHWFVLHSSLCPPHTLTFELKSMITLWSNKKTTKNPKTTIRKILLFSKLIMTMDAHKWIQHKSASLYTARHVFVASVNICGNTTWHSREADLIHYESEWNDATNLTCGNGLNITLIVELLLITWLLSASLSSLSISSIHDLSAPSSYRFVRKGSSFHESSACVFLKNIILCSAIPRPSPHGWHFLLS